METDIKAAKRRIRQEIASRLAGLEPGYIREGSEEAFRRLQAAGVWERAESIMLFAPMGPEIDVWPWLLAALEQGKTVALPRFDPATRQYTARIVKHPVNDIVQGHFGIREPALECAVMPLFRLDLVLVPGVAFDLYGRRLGRGKGYYDRMLANARGETCGIAFEEQILEAVPVEPHDRQLTCILTPKRWVAAKRGSV